ncbi:MAG: hypothetical protein JWM92_4 [Candidatus Nomurabacteria bacterium]|jgi:2-phosphoglycerate kinase|nr:hypothetical protein [Candidatus Nomurabacteria bacterium]
MLYLIGGAPRAGKSLLAQRMLVENQVPFFPLDALIGTLTFAAPEFDINHDLSFKIKSEKVWRFTEHLFNHFLYEEENYLVEGDCILPEQVVEFKKTHDKEIRCCFIGYTKLSAEEKLNFVRTYNRGDTDWTNEQTDEALLEMIEKMIEYSMFLQEECAKHGIMFFDVSDDFSTVQDEAFEYLSEK